MGAGPDPVLFRWGGAVASSPTSESGSERVWCKSTSVGGLWPRDGRAVMALFIVLFVCLFL